MCEVCDAHGDVEKASAAAQLDDAGGTTGDDNFGAGAANVGHLAFEDFHGLVIVKDVVGAGRPAAPVGFGQLGEVHAWGAAENLAGRLSEVLVAAQVARVVIGDADRSGMGWWRSIECELGELMDLRGEPDGVGVVGEKRRITLQERVATAAVGDDEVGIQGREGLEVLAGKEAGAFEVAVGPGWQPAAIVLEDFDAAVGCEQGAECGLADLREGEVVAATHEICDASGGAVRAQVPRVHEVHEELRREGVEDAVGRGGLCADPAQDTKAVGRVCETSALAESNGPKEACHAAGIGQEVAEEPPQRCRETVAADVFVAGGHQDLVRVERSEAL